MRGSFDLRTGHLHLEEQPEALLENDTLIAFCVGDILYDKTDPAQFRELLQHPDKDCSFYFEGPFLLLLYFKQEKRLFITQHPFGTPCNFFFAQSEGLFYFGTALSGIRDMLPIPFLLNTSALPQFIRNGFLTGTDTLSSGVEKLPPEYSLTIGENEFRFTRLRWYGDSEPEADLNLEGLYDQVMEKAIRTSMDAFHAPEELTVTLSGGYDSNCILHYIKKLEPDAVVH
ncbi:MAG: hypothetical protein LUD73_04335, partial [Lachnospiraceae bacterium]|nr:hypothetical protein [Lachnospiraceae bacterium]